MAFDGSAVARLYRAKGRTRDNPVPVLIANSSELPKIALKSPPMANRLAARFWPGPVTLVVWRKSSLPEEISQTPTVGVRVPDHPLALTLLAIAGPLAATSANRSGDPPACTAEDVMESLGGKIDLILDDGMTRGGEPSTVVDCTQAVPRILRHGPITEEEIVAVLTSK